MLLYIRVAIKNHLILQLTRGNNTQYTRPCKWATNDILFMAATIYYAQGRYGWSRAHLQRIAFSWIVSTIVMITHEHCLQSIDLILRRSGALIGHKINRLLRCLFDGAKYSIAWLATSSRHANSAPKCKSRTWTFNRLHFSTHVDELFLCCMHRNFRIFFFFLPSMAFHSNWRAYNLVQVNRWPLATDTNSTKCTFVVHT